MKADIPATIPASIVNANAGLKAISAKIVSPAGVDLYNEFVNDVPMINKSRIATMSPTDHLPNVVFWYDLHGGHNIFILHLTSFSHEFTQVFLSRINPLRSLC